MLTLHQNVIKYFLKFIWKLSFQPTSCKMIFKDSLYGLKKHKTDLNDFFFILQL